MIEVMFENFSELYRHHGGLKSILKSGYFWTSLGLTLVSIPSASNSEWSEKTLIIMPALTGFTIAALAILFLVIDLILDADKKMLLMALDSQGKSPVTMLAARIGHALVVQVFAIIIALLFEFYSSTEIILALEILKVGAPKWSLAYFDLATCAVSLLSFLGVLSTYYGVLLVLATTLAIARTQQTISRSLPAITKTNKRKQSSNPSSDK